MNPRIVKGHKGSGMAFAARGRAGGDTFMLGVSARSVESYDRLRVEDALMVEARSLIERAGHSAGIAWSALRFEHHADFDVWEKMLTADELDRLMEA